MFVLFAGVGVKKKNRIKEAEMNRKRDKIILYGLVFGFFNIISEVPRKSSQET